MFADYGTVTLLFQDSVRKRSFVLLDLDLFGCQVGGLEVQNPHTQNFQPAVPIVRLDSEAQF